MIFPRNKPKPIAFYTLYEIIARKTEAEAVLMSFAQQRMATRECGGISSSCLWLLSSLWSPTRKISGMAGRMLLRPCLGAMWKVSDGKLVGSKESLWTEHVSQQRRCWVSLKMSGQNTQAKVHIHRRENAGQRVDKQYKNEVAA